MEEELREIEIAMASAGGGGEGSGRREQRGASQGSRGGRDPETSAGISDFLPRSFGRGSDAGPDSAEEPRPESCHLLLRAHCKGG